MRHDDETGIYSSAVISSAERKILRIRSGQV